MGLNTSPVFDANTEGKRKWRMRKKKWVSGEPAQLTVLIGLISSNKEEVLLKQVKY